MRIQGSSSVPPSSGRSISNTFQISWKGLPANWHIPNHNDIPIGAAKEAVTELLTREQGRAFLLPALEKACGSAVSLSEIKDHLTITLVQEGSDSGIFRLDAKVRRAGGDQKTSVCLNVAKSNILNGLHRDIFNNLQQLKKLDPKYVVEPYAFELAAAPYAGDQVKLAVLCTEWLEGFVEVNMFNAAEAIDGGPPLDGLEVVGLRRLRFNVPAKSLKEGVVEDGALANELASEMVKILALYFDAQNAGAIADYGINCGDFVYRARPDGGFDLKLVTCRKIQHFPARSVYDEHLKVFLFLKELFRHRENSVHHQLWMPGNQAVKYAVHTFTPTDICRGIKKALVERFGEEQARGSVIKCLCTYLLASGEMQKTAPTETFKTQIKHQMDKREIEDFINAEYRPTI